MEKEQILGLYKKSAFYEKYKGTYVSDKILKEVFGENIRVHCADGLKHTRRCISLMWML